MDRSTLVTKKGEPDWQARYYFLLEKLLDVYGRENDRLAEENKKLRGKLLPETFDLSFN